MSKYTVMMRKEMMNYLDEEADMPEMVYDTVSGEALGSREVFLARRKELQQMEEFSVFRRVRADGLEAAMPKGVVEVDRHEKGQ